MQTYKCDQQAVVTHLLVRFGDCSNRVYTVLTVLLEYIDYWAIYADSFYTHFL